MIVFISDRTQCSTETGTCKWIQQQDNTALFYRIKDLVTRTNQYSNRIKVYKYNVNINSPSREPGHASDRAVASVPVLCEHTMLEDISVAAPRSSVAIIVQLYHGSDLELWLVCRLCYWTHFPARCSFMGYMLPSDCEVGSLICLSVSGYTPNSIRGANWRHLPQLKGGCMRGHLGNCISWIFKCFHWNKKKDQVHHLREYSLMFLHAIGGAHILTRAI